MAISINVERVTEGSITVSITGIQASDVDRYLTLSYKYATTSSESYDLAHGWNIPAGETPATHYRDTIGGTNGNLRPNTTYMIKVEEYGGSVISTTHSAASTSVAAGEISVDATSNSFTVHFSNYEGYKPYERIAEIGYRENNKYGPLVAREYISIPPNVPRSTISATFDTADISPGKRFYAYVEVWYKATTDSLGSYQRLGYDVSIPYADISYALVDFVNYTAPMETATVGGRLYLYQDTLPDTTISLYAQYPENGTQVYRRLGPIPTTGTTTWEMEVDVSWAMESTRFYFWGVSVYEHDGESVHYKSPDTRPFYIQRLFSWPVPPLYDSIRFEHHDFNKLIQYGRKAHELYPEFFPADFQIEYVDTDDPWLASDATRIGWANRTILPYEPIRIADIQYMMDVMQENLRRAIRNGS